MRKLTLIVFLISLGLSELSTAFEVEVKQSNKLESKLACDPKLCQNICGTTGVDDFTAFSCNPFTCKCYCNNPPPPNCLPDRDGRCDLYCKETYCASYFGILCGAYNSPVCTCACNPYGPYLRNNTDTTSISTNMTL